VVCFGHHQHRACAAFERRPSHFGVSLEVPLNSEEGAVAAFLDVPADRSRVLAIQQRVGASDAKLSPLERADLEVPVRADPDILDPRSRCTHEIGGEQHRWNHDGERAEQTVDRRSAWSARGDSVERLEILVAPQRRSGRHSAPVSVERVEQPRGAVERQDVVGVEKADPVTGGRSYSRVAAPSP
jgi:hypothetical protein